MKKELGIISLLIVVTFILSNSSADSIPIEKIIAENHRIVDGNDFETILKNVEILQKIKFAVDITNPQDQAQQVATLVGVLNSNEDSVFENWSEIVLDPAATSTQTINWIPKQAGLYTVSFFFWEAADIPIALAPVTTLEFEVLPVDESLAQECEEVTLEYEIEGGTVTEACYDKTIYSLFVSIDATEDGKITMTLPKSLVFSLDQECNSAGDIIILLNDDDVISSSLPETNTARIVSLDFEKGENTIEFISDYTLDMPSPTLICGSVYGYDSQYVPPKLQLKNGVSSQDVKCNQGLELIFKASNDLPACVKESTAEKLLQLGWASKTTKTSEIQSDIPWYYETDEDGNLIKPETTDWLFDKGKPLAEIFEDPITPNCEYDFAYMSNIMDITVMCYKVKWYVIYDAWTDTHYRLPE